MLETLPQLKISDHFSILCKETLPTKYNTCHITIIK